MLQNAKQCQCGSFTLSLSSFLSPSLRISLSLSRSLCLALCRNEFWTADKRRTWTWATGNWQLQCVFARPFDGWFLSPGNSPGGQPLPLKSYQHLWRQLRSAFCSTSVSVSVSVSASADWLWAHVATLNTLNTHRFCLVCLHFAFFFLPLSLSLSLFCLGQRCRSCYCVSLFCCLKFSLLLLLLLTLLLLLLLLSAKV